MLDLAAVLSLAQACAPGVAPETLAAVAYVESRFDAMVIGVNRGPRPTRLSRNHAEAARVAQSLLARGADLDLGLAQINSRNLAAAATVLRAGYRPASDNPIHRQAALRVALSRYNTGHPRRGFRNGYVARVEAAAVRLSLTLPVPADAPSPDEPIRLAAEAPPQAWDVFARARGAVVITFSPDPIGSSLP